MQLSLLRTAGVPMIVSLLVAGCAAREPRGLASSFVRPGEPRTRLPADIVAPPASLEAFIGKVRELSANARPMPKQNLLPTVETEDSGLAAALLRLAIRPASEQHRAVAREYARLGILDVAHRHLTRAVQLDPADAAAHDGLARIWRNWRLPHLGLADAHRAVYFAPSSPTAHNTLGTVLHALGRAREAERAYRRALRLDPDAAYALNNLCRLALDEGRRDEAVPLCERALAIDPALAAARANLLRLRELAAVARGAGRPGEIANGPASDDRAARLSLAADRRLGPPPTPGPAFNTGE
jgi:Flp pilus assembly protein TadD